jgi:hypothetical protein
MLIKKQLLFLFDVLITIIIFKTDELPQDAIDEEVEKVRAEIYAEKYSC